MTRRPSRLALALLERCVPDSEALAGDLVEEFARRQSRLWLWHQVVLGIAAARSARRLEIRPLRVVNAQPVEAMSRTLEFQRRMRPVNLSASPTPSVGGLGLLAMVGLVSVTSPVLWVGLAAALAAGAVFGVVLIGAHSRGCLRERSIIGWH